MKTAYDNFTAKDNRGKIIDLDAWRAAHLDEFREEAEEPPVFVPRPRRSRRSMPASELVSTLSVAAAALVLILRILTF